MCFSAQASFASGVVISAMGVATVSKVNKPEQRLFASIPLLFAFQQFAEGVLWVTLRSGGWAGLQNSAAHIFLTGALVIWPVMVPLAMWLMEGSKTRKRILAGLGVVGAAVSLFYIVCLITYSVTPEISGFHLVYNNNFPGNLLTIAFYFYIASTVAPLFVSSVKHMWGFGVLIAASCVVTGIFYSQYLTSVWCFFAALISISIYWVLIETRSKEVLLATEIQP